MPGRARSVTTLALAVLLLAAVNCVRAARVFLGSAFLAQLKLSASPLYLGASGLAWGLLFGAAAAGLWYLRPWGRWLALAGIVLYQAQAWFNRLLFDSSTYARLVWPWQGAISVLSVALTWGILWWPAIRAAFERDRSRG
jgi:hypothetical protein